MAGKFVLVFFLTILLFGLLILVGTFFGAIGLGVAFAIYIGVGIWYYNYSNEKEKCPK